jgi:hypothetical protein
MSLDFLLDTNKNYSYNNITALIELIFASITEFLKKYIAKNNGVIICNSETNYDCRPLIINSDNVGLIKNYMMSIDTLDSVRILQMINIAEKLLTFTSKFTNTDKSFITIDLITKNRLEILILKALTLIDLNNKSISDNDALSKMEKGNIDGGISNVGNIIEKLKKAVNKENFGKSKKDSIKIHRGYKKKTPKRKKPSKRSKRKYKIR